MAKTKDEASEKTKYQLQEAGTGMILVGLLGLMLYLSVQAPVYPVGIIIIGALLFAAGRMLK